MAKLRAAQRNKLPASAFGLPGERKYPVEKMSGGKAVPDKIHARVAKSYASKEEHAGKITKGEEQQIDRKANAVLHQSAGGAAHSKHVSTPAMHKNIVHSNHLKKLRHG